MNDDKCRPGRRLIRTYLLPTLPVAFLAVGSLGCGPKVEAVDTARVAEREADAEVLVFVRESNGIPSCPWEILGTIEVDDGWVEDEGDLRDVKRAAARLGGHAVFAETAADDHVRVLRFFDPLCNPLRDRD